MVHRERINRPRIRAADVQQGTNVNDYLVVGPSTNFRVGPPTLSYTDGGVRFEDTLIDFTILDPPHSEPLPALAIAEQLQVAAARTISNRARARDAAAFIGLTGPDDPTISTEEAALDHARGTQYPQLGAAVHLDRLATAFERLAKGLREGRVMPEQMPNGKYMTLSSCLGPDEWLSQKLEFGFYVTDRAHPIDQSEHD